MVLTAYRYNVYAYIHSKFNDSSRKFVALATVFTISWLKAGWCFGFCRSSFWIFWNPTNHPKTHLPTTHSSQLRRERPSYDARVPTCESFPRLHRAHQAKRFGWKVWCFFSVGGSCLKKGSSVPRGMGNQTNQWSFFVEWCFFVFFCSNFKRQWNQDLMECHPGLYCQTSCLISPLW